ncbi:MAG: aminotransferase class V-fold PLP-dependent enzyme [Oscillospiraceae bacterium]
MKTIYLDNAATSYPKPDGVSAAMCNYIDNIGATINRSVYGSARDVGLEALELREMLCRLLGFSFPTHTVLTCGATAALNMVIKGFLRPGDHCIVSSMEHNAVMRPLQQLSETGCSFSRIPCDCDGRLNPCDILPLIKSNTRLLVMAHASNVCGTLQDAEAVGKICHKHGIAFVLDAAQTAGHYPVDFEKFQLSALCVPGHKGLLGPSGIGAMMLSKDFCEKLEPIISGGTGSASDSELVPHYMPDRFEAGTPNIPGIYGLHQSVDYILKTGVDTLRRHELALTAQFLNGLSDIDGVRLCGTKDLAKRVGVISLDFTQLDNADIAFKLESEFGVLTRCGLHCSPSAHKTLCTFPEGTVRFSVGFSTTPNDIDYALDAIARVLFAERNTSRQKAIL